MYFVVSLCFTAEGVFVIRQNEFPWAATWVLKPICSHWKLFYIVQVKKLQQLHVFTYIHTAYRKSIFI